MTSTYSNLFFSFLSRHLTTFFDRNWIKINSIWNKVDKIFLKKKSSYNSIKLQVHNGTQSDGIINVEKKRQGGKNKTNPWAPNFFVSRPHFLFREIPRAICNYFSFRSKRRRRRKKNSISCWARHYATGGLMDESRNRSVVVTPSKKEKNE